MVTDFRNVGRVPETSQTSSTSAAPDSGQAVIVLSLYSAAVLFLFAGLWLILGQQTIFPPEQARIMGVAFIVSAIGDVIAVKVIRRVWANRGRSFTP